MSSEGNKVTFKQAAKEFTTTFKQAEMTIYSIVITYYLLLAFFPLLIAVGNILPYLHISQENILPYIKELLPADIYLILKDTILNLLAKSNGGLLSVSAIGTFWAVSKGINGIQISLNKAYGIPKQKMQFLRRIFSFLMVFFLLFVISLLLIFMGFGQTILEYALPRFGLPQDILATFIKLRWPVTSVILLVILFMLYYWVPNAKVHLRTIIPGAIFTTMSWMIVTQFFSLYINYFFRRINSYGILGGFIIFILWLNLAAKLIILGGVINVTVEKLVYGKIQKKKNVIDYYIEDRLSKEEDEHADLKKVLDRHGNKQKKSDKLGR
ncbi:hypothetical protein CBF34_02630 [Vagococcus penaei]|uniref:Uncharacterized protein n=1 Tax=Vagococcus penaei TaxID=633807 RepID=A0A1Q2D447_9ENTE|nr:YihY/virulence factor BrkB family protein [Vagococcus penaei]AQP53113.1 hypothetical protein BW732_01960 [Vagococcus penaei]RSU06025.1 hypothetical protein CBF34_02630 [Vagococcus penaei]